jgi:hypothetical protein
LCKMRFAPTAAAQVVGLAFRSPTALPVVW